MGLATYIYMGIWVYTGEVTSRRVRENYLKSVLRQDPAFFDTVRSILALALRFLLFSLSLRFQANLQDVFPSFPAEP